MEQIFKGIFGSRLYGTHNENSDYDVRQIHKSSLEEIILKKNLNNIPKEEGSEVDFESKELRIFINDCLYGQTYAYDLLFTPKNLWVSYSDIWNDIYENRHKLVTNNMKPFLAYCRGRPESILRKAIN